MTTNERLDKQLADLREMESTLSAIHVSMNALIGERDLLRDENQRLQLEVARLRLANADAEYALNEILPAYERLLPEDVNPGANRYSTIVRHALKKIGDNKLTLNLEYR